MGHRPIPLHQKLCLGLLLHLVNAQHTLTCWGEDTRGQLAAPAGVDRVADGGLAIGDGFACGIFGTSVAGPITCWGSGIDVAMVPSGDFIDVRAGLQFACARQTAGGISCWGLVLGLPPAGMVVAYDVGDSHGCVLGIAGVFCWGDDTYGQTNVPPSLTTPGQIACGSTFSCAEEGGGLICWGQDSSSVGILPAGWYPHRVAAAGSHACDVNGNEFECWGDLSDGRQPPAAAAAGVDQIAVARSFNCFLTPSFALECGGVAAAVPAGQPLLREAGAGIFQSVWAGPSMACALLVLAPTTSASTSTATTTSTGTVTTSTTWTGTVTASTTSTGTTSTGTVTTSATSTGTVMTTTTVTSTVMTSITFSGTVTTSATSTVTETSVTSTTTSGGVTSTTTSASSATSTSASTSSILSTMATSGTSTSSLSTSFAPSSSTAVGWTASPTMAADSTSRAVGTSATRPTTPTLLVTSTLPGRMEPMSSTMPSAGKTSSAPGTTASANGSSAVAEPSKPWVEAGLIKAEGEASAGLLLQLSGSFSHTVGAPLSLGGSVVAAKLSRALSVGTAEGQYQSVMVPPHMEVRVPLEALPASDEELALVVAVVDPGMVAAAAEEVVAAAALNFRRVRDGTRWPVSGLRQPVRFSLPVNFTAGMRCAYWNEESRVWSAEGVETLASNMEGEQLWCATVHLSLFGALLRGATETMLCSNVHLFSLEALRALFSTQWQGSRGSIVFGALLLLLAVMGLVGRVLDRERTHVWSWSEEFFLSGADAEAAVQGSSQDTLNENPGYDSIASSGPAIPVMAFSTLCCGCSCCAVVQEKSRSVLCQALQDILCSWFAYFAELRSIVQELLWGLGPDGAAMGTGLSLAHWGTLRQRATSTAMVITSRRATAAMLGLSTETVHMVMQDQGLRSFLAARSEAATLEPSVSFMSGSSSGSSGAWRTRPNQRQAWLELRNEVLADVLRQTRQQEKRLALRTACQVFASQGPLGSLFIKDVHRSCKERVLLLAAQLLGALACCCLFFQSAECDESVGTGAAAGVGRFLVLALGSLVLAGGPVAVLRSLQTKKFTVLTCTKASEEWQRRLKVWQVQGCVLWLLGPLYVGLCCLLVCLFLASASEDERMDWGATGLLALLQELLMLPFLTAVLAPLGARALLLLQAVAEGVSREQLVEEACQSIYRRLVLPVEDV